MASTYLSINIHLVFATKERLHLIDDSWRDNLHAYIGGTARGLGAAPLAVGGVTDHVHLLAGIKATHCVADLAREIKKVSSLLATERHKGFGWQKGYGAFSVSASQVPSVAAYIQRQVEHHRKVSAIDELREMLAEFNVACDDRYFE